MFEGVRVLEVSAWVMVPGSGVLMSDLGAEVIKVEHPTAGDPARGLVTGGVTPSVGSVNMMVEQTNRGKRSIGLDMSTPEGREILYELAANADIFLTSLLPAVRQKLQIDVEHIRKQNPDIIYAKADAVGAVGDEQGKPGFDSAVFFGRAGILNSFSQAAPATDSNADDNEHDNRARTLPTPRPGFGDKTAALSLAFGMASALFKRERTGEPSVIDVSLLGSAMWVASSDIIYSWASKTDFSSIEREATNPIAHRYQTKDGRWIMLAMLASDRWWPEFVRHIDRAELGDDPRFSSAALRAQNNEECIAELSSTFASATLEEWRVQLADLHGPWEVIQNSHEVSADAQAISNGYIESVDHPNGVEVKAIRTPVQIDGQPHELSIAPDAWQHTEEILLELGHDWDRIIELKDLGIIP
jgi:crotonobetainyl-CoA:carnitine CoA-transferase CaiB-like acyl-CoA transferase